MRGSVLPGDDAAASVRGRRGSRRALLALSAATLAFGTLRAAAQPPRPKRRVGVVTNAWAADHPTVLGLKSGLRERGLEEGRDVSFDVRFTTGRPEAAPELARALVEGGADVIFAVGTASALAAKAVTTELPVVFAQVGDPVADGVVTDLARPGGNVTGVSSIAADLMPKRVEILKTLYPQLSRIWVPSLAGDPTAQAGAAGVRAAATALRVSVEAAELRGDEELERISVLLGPGDGLLVPGIDAFGLSAALLRLSTTKRVPAVFPSSLWVGYGGLVSYGPDVFALGTQASRQVVKVLGGTRPGDLPVESADVLDLALNLGTAGAMALEVPRKILLRANTIRR